MKTQRSGAGVTGHLAIILYAPALMIMSLALLQVLGFWRNVQPDWVDTIPPIATTAGLSAVLGSVFVTVWPYFRRQGLLRLEADSKLAILFSLVLGPMLGAGQVGLMILFSTMLDPGLEGFAVSLPEVLTVFTISGTATVYLGYLLYTRWPKEAEQQEDLLKDDEKAPLVDNGFPSKASLLGIAMIAATMFFVSNRWGITVEQPAFSTVVFLLVFGQGPRVEGLWAKSRQSKLRRLAAIAGPTLLAVFSALFISGKMPRFPDTVIWFVAFEATFSLIAILRVALFQRAQKQLQN